MIEEIARVECRIADKFKSAAVHFIRPGLCDYIVETSRPVSDFWGHHSRTRLHLVNGINIKV